MFIVRIILFFVLVTISIVGTLIALSNPGFIVVPLVCVPLALFIVGWTSRYSTAETKLRKYEEELALSKSSTYKYRQIFVSLIAILLGIISLYLSFYASGKGGDSTVVFGGATFLILGLGSLISAARGNTHQPTPSEEVLQALASRYKETRDSKDLDDFYNALRRSLIAKGVSEQKIAAIEAEAKAEVEKIRKKIDADIARTCSNTNRERV